jgi:hypothetical protein
MKTIVLALLSLLQPFERPIALARQEHAPRAEYDYHWRQISELDRAWYGVRDPKWGRGPMWAMYRDPPWAPSRVPIREVLPNGVVWPMVDPEDGTEFIPYVLPP